MEERPLKIETNLPIPLELYHYYENEKNKYQIFSAVV